MVSPKRANNLAKEVCGFCRNEIKIGPPTAICEKCDSIFHGKCIRPENFAAIGGSYFCANCVTEHSLQPDLGQRDPERYNPFHDIFNNNHSDKFYEDEPFEFYEFTEHTSKILETCHQYDGKGFNKLIKNLNPKSDTEIFSTFFLNLDGNKTNFDELVVNLNQINHNFSIVGLAETNIDTANKDIYRITDEYTSVYQSSSFNKHKGSGVGMYIHNKYNFTTLHNLSICNDNIETLFVSITNLEQPTTVGVLYRPPSGSMKLFNKELRSLLLNIQTCSNTYILGDFNVNLLNLMNKHDEEFEEIMLTSLHPLISTATHTQPHCVGTCIDNIFTSNSNKVATSGTLNWNISHHSPIFQISKHHSQSSSKVEVEKIKIYYEYSQRNTGDFCVHLKEAMEANPINKFDDFDVIFQTSKDATCKLKVPKTTKRNAICNPWITPGLIRCIGKKDDLYKAWKASLKIRNKNHHKSPELHENYKLYRKVLNNLIKSAKQKHTFAEFDKHKTNKKKTWEIINKLRGKGKHGLKACFSIDNERVICRRVIANKFNDYFISLAKNLNASAYLDKPLESFPSFRTYLGKHCPSSIFLEDCDLVEIQKIIGELENGKASDIPIMLVKKSADITAPTLVRLYNDCMISGTFPDILKIGRITPIYKKGDRELIENYRPVSTLPVFGKIFEKVIYSRIYDFFTSKGILSESQFGFRKGHSTSHAIHSSVNIIKEAHKTNKHVIGVFIDLSKAFDTLDHSILLDKLDNNGIRGNANKLIESYLTNRQQYTSVLGESSELRSITFGVPQGSVLGPLLFLLYINDLLNCCKGEDCKFVLYADDTNLFVTADSRDDAITKANKILIDINNYMKSNLLHINIGKCCYMYFEPPTHYRALQRSISASCARSRQYTRKLDMPMPTVVEIDGNKIDEVSEAKFLGVTIDARLTWVPHIDQLHRKLKSVTGILNRIKNCIPTENYKALYHALFESHLSYCLTVFGGVGATHQEKLFRVQKHAMRIMFGDFKAVLEKSKTCARVRKFGTQVLGPEFYCKEHTKKLFNDQKILTIRNIYEYQCCTDIFKILKFRTPSCLFEKLESSQRSDGLRLILPTLAGDFIYNGSKLWNTAIQALKLEGGINSIKTGVFKRGLKTALLSLETKHGEEWHPYNFGLESALRR